MRKTPLFILMFIAGIICPTICTVNSIEFKQHCAGYLKQAADANTPEIALDRITRALNYIEAHGMIGGYTSVIYKTEDENVGFWYENIKACKKELEACLDGTQLEKSNVLMKVRESLTDEGNNGTELTIPDGISRYPENTQWAILNTISAILLIIVVGHIAYKYF